MAKKYRFDVCETVRDDGVGLLPFVGEAAVIDGEPFVKIGSAYIPATDYSDTRADAKLIAADEIEQMALRLIAQANKLRAEAAAEAVS